MRGRIATAAAIAFGAAVLGHAIAGLPQPGNHSDFWIGNYSAPWALLAFLVGWSRRSPAAATSAAILAEVACVVGFYDLPGFLVGFCKGMPLEQCLGAPPGTSPISLELTLLRLWLQGSAGQWLIAGVGTGIVYGLLGSWWARSRSLMPAILLALPFLAEPVAWRAYLGRLQGPAALWVLEALVGVALLGAMMVAGRRAPPRAAA